MFYCSPHHLSLCIIPKMLTWWIVRRNDSSDCSVHDWEGWKVAWWWGYANYGLRDITSKHWHRFSQNALCNGYIKWKNYRIFQYNYKYYIYIYIYTFIQNHSLSFIDILDDDDGTGVVSVGSLLIQDCQLLATIWNVASEFWMHAWKLQLHPSIMGWLPSSEHFIPKPKMVMFFGRNK